MRVKVILNPSADRGRAIALKPEMEKWGREFGGLDVELTQEPGHAETLAAQAQAEGYDIVAAAGGDGTIHEVVNGLLRQGQPASAALGLVPLGTGNDYAHGLGLWAPPSASIQRIFTGERQLLDVAALRDDHGRYRFICNGIGIGFDAVVTIESLKITWLYGFSAYLLATLRSIVFHYQSPSLSLRFDDEEEEQPALLFAVGVGQRVGGGFYLTPAASFTDGLLDSCLVDPIGRVTMLAMMPRVLRGTHVTASFVHMRRSRSIEVVSDRPLPIHLDGEVFAREEDEVREVTIDSVAGALPIIM